LVAEEDGSVQQRLRARTSLVDLGQHVRRARACASDGPRQSWARGADAGPAAPQAPP